MIKKFIPIKGEAVTKQTYNDFITTIQTDGYALTNIGSSFLGKTIYGYGIGNPNKPSIVIWGSEHGSEWIAAYYVKKLMYILKSGIYQGLTKDIQRLRSKFHFYFVPCANPDGFDLGTRQNANHVDINRNWDAYWEEYDDTDLPTRKKGSAPFSEPETQALRDICLQYNPIMLFDCHTNSGSSTLQRPRDFKHYFKLQENLNDSIQLSALSATWGEMLRPGLQPMSGYWWDNQQPKYGMRHFSTWIEPTDAVSVMETVYCGLNLVWGCILGLEKYYKDRILV
jgi:hypothetical protein